MGLDKDYIDRRWCPYRKGFSFEGHFQFVEPLGKDEKSKSVLGGSPGSYKTMDGIDNLLCFLPAYCVNSYDLMLLLPVVVASLSPSSGALFANRWLFNLFSLLEMVSIFSGTTQFRGSCSLCHLFLPRSLKSKNVSLPFLRSLAFVIYHH